MGATSPYDQGVYIQSLGAAQTVTGSKHLLITPDMKIMIDCGLFQGLKSLREKNWEPLPVDVSTIDAIILTHAHLDHCGYLPRLIKDGFKGKVYMSRPTRDLTELILRDSASLQEEDAMKANKHGYSRHKPALPLYDTGDVEAALPFFKSIGFEETYKLSKDIWFKFFPSGHIPGACSVEITCYEKTIVFSGDIGRYHSELLPAPCHTLNADYVIMESTYGDRLHESYDVEKHLAYIINETLSNNGNVLVPCFAVGRAQEMIHLLYKIKQHDRIPASVPVYLDSPMAAQASKVLLKYPGWIKITEKECAQMFSGITINRDFEGTEKIIKQKRSKIILAGSGMLTGGRALEYLKHYITDSNNTILIIGFQAEGTRGRALLNRAYEIKMHGRYYPVKAEVKEIPGLSAHADQSELLTWLKGFTTRPKQVFLVHGEPGAQDTLRVKIKDELGLNVTILKQDQKELLFHINQDKDQFSGNGKNHNRNI